MSGSISSGGILSSSILSRGILPVTICLVTFRPGLVRWTFVVVLIRWKAFCGSALSICPSVSVSRITLKVLDKLKKVSGWLGLPL